ncbi:glycosyltransferase [Pseudomonas peradeniyensis]|uniref:glycosyltransferase family 2 protein n=1 Tax=Pseudomonas peradeniyensis TaxID=2745488 RepID=UPI0021D4D950|nr:glycosyltransferase [Pseudomonas peradeniyensis]
MTRKLFSKRSQPYYIYAPDYRRSSAGIRVLHMLCDALNRSGQEAYVTTRVLEPQLVTPYLTDDIIALHKSQRLEPIVVYPEIVDGNPLGGKAVVRYLLNKPGHLGGRGEYAKDDLIFAYTRGLLPAGVSEQNVLYCPAIDLSIFRPPLDGNTRVPGKVCYYQGRSGQALVDPTLLPPDAVEITPTFPGSWEALASLFQQCEYLYLGERSGLAAEAVLCGCVCIVIPGKWAPEPLSLSENNSYGTAWGNSPEAVKRARETLPLLHARQVEHQSSFWSSLDYFIETTQAVAESMAIADRFGRLSWLRERVPDAQQLTLIAQRLDSAQVPLLDVIILNVEDNCDALQRSLASLADNTYIPSRVFVLGGECLETADVQWLAVDTSPKVEVINAAIRQSTASWVLLVEAGVEFTDSGLLVAALDLLDAPDDCLAVYADEVLRAKSGVIDVHFRPDLSLDLLLSDPAGQSRHWLYRRERLEQARFAVEAGAAFELAYQLSLIEQFGLACIGHINEPLLITEEWQGASQSDERAVIERHLRARGYPQACAAEKPGGGYRIDYAHGQQPFVSILVYLEGSLALCQRCVESLLETTQYPHFELLLIDPGIDDEATLAWLALIEQLGASRMKVVRLPSVSNRASHCNAAAEYARGDFLLWLSAGIGVFEGNWMSQMLNHALRPEVGAVGAKLVTDEFKVYHAGLVLGLGGEVGRAFTDWPGQDAGYMGRLQVDQNYSAVSSECFMISRAVFVELEGFSEDPLLAPWVDVDLCLRLRQAGYLNVWTPHAQLLISPVPRPSATSEQENALFERWLPQLANDPIYNSNLSLRRDQAFVPDNNVIVWRPTKGILPTVLAYTSDTQASAQDRLIQPGAHLREAGMVDALVLQKPLMPVELERLKPDTVIWQRPVDDGALSSARRLRTFSTALQIYDLDGYLPHMAIGKSYDADDLLQRLRLGLMQADRVLVATPALADLVQGHCDDVRVLQSALPTSWRNLKSQRRVGDKPRVGWVGTAEAGELLAQVVPALVTDVDWVVLGECPLHLQPYVKEQYASVAADRLPAALAALNLDLALAPMLESMANACAGSQRVLQHAACGHPVICSRVNGFTGADALPLSRADNNASDWLRMIRMHLADRDASAALGDALQAAVRADWLLEGARLEEWRRAWLA